MFINQATYIFQYYFNFIIELLRDSGEYLHSVIIIIFFTDVRSPVFQPYNYTIVSTEECHIYRIQLKLNNHKFTTIHTIIS